MQGGYRLDNELATVSDRVIQRYEMVRARLEDHKKVKEVIREFNVSAPTLYKYIHRFQEHGIFGLIDYPRGPKNPSNKLPPVWERRITEFHRMNPTRSSYKIAKLVSEEGRDVSPRTIQRVLRRNGLRRKNRVAAKNRTSKEMSQRTQEWNDNGRRYWSRKRVASWIEATVMVIHSRKQYFGCYRIMFELRNIHHIYICHMTVWRIIKRCSYREETTRVEKKQWLFYEYKRPHSMWHADFLHAKELQDGKPVYQITIQDDYSRGYVGCDIFRERDVRNLILTLIQAIRNWKVIPTLLLVDNGSECKSKLLTAFCERVGITITRSRVEHPQTNGKQERAFRDDREEFWNDNDTQDFELLKKKHREFVWYRNHLKGQWALKGDPPISRLKENKRPTPEIDLSRLEELADVFMVTRHVDSKGFISYFNNRHYVDVELSQRIVNLHLTLNGIEGRYDSKTCSVIDHWNLTKEYNQLHN